jgi:hypothetical protein
MRRIAVAFFVAAAVAMLSVVAAVGPAASQEARSISLDFPESEPIYLSDVGRNGPSKGDVLLFRGMLTDEEGTAVGTLVAEATLYGRGMDRAQMFATITLADGTMSFQGAYNFEVADQGHLGLTGGAGAYVGAQGSLHGTIEETGKVNLDITLQS